MAARPVIAGLDLSLTATGIAVFTDGATRTALVRSGGTRQDSWLQRHDRIRGLVEKIAGHVPPGALVAIEAYGSTTGSVTDRAALWWMTFGALRDIGCTIVPIPPTVRAKYATGKGNAGKDVVLAAAVRRYPHIDINTNDEADAVILMAIGCRLIGAPIDDPLPVLQLAALNNLHLPEALTRRAA